MPLDFEALNKALDMLAEWQKRDPQGAEGFIVGLNEWTKTIEAYFQKCLDEGMRDSTIILANMPRPSWRYRCVPLHGEDSNEL